MELPWSWWRGFPPLLGRQWWCSGCRYFTVCHLHPKASFALDGTVITLVTPPHLFTKKPPQHRKQGGLPWNAPVSVPILQLPLVYWPMNAVTHVDLLLLSLGVTGTPETFWAQPYLWWACSEQLPGCNPHWIIQCSFRALCFCHSYCNSEHGMLIRLQHLNIFSNIVFLYQNLLPSICKFLQLADPLCLSSLSTIHLKCISQYFLFKP